VARRKKPLAPRCLIVDSGALIGWARGDVRPRAMLARALELGVDVRIPTPVLAETLRGGPRDAPIHRVRASVDVFPQTEAVARLAGALLGRTRGKNTVDALVAAEAIAAGADVLTSDAKDLAALLAAHRSLTVLAV
jgi:predicted nucleic acid-binding protein